MMVLRYTEAFYQQQMIKDVLPKTFSVEETRDVVKGHDLSAKQSSST
jgi:hypothetical protein